MSEADRAQDQHAVRSGSRVLDVDPSQAGFIWRKQKIFGPLAALVAVVLVTVGCILFVFFGATATPTSDSLNVTTSANNSTSFARIVPGLRGRFFGPQPEEEPAAPLGDTPDFGSMMSELSNVMSDAFNAISNEIEQQQEQHEQQQAAIVTSAEANPGIGDVLLPPIVVYDPVEVVNHVVATTTTTTTRRPTTTTTEAYEQRNIFGGINLGMLFPLSPSGESTLTSTTSTTTESPHTTTTERDYQPAETYPFQSYHHRLSDIPTWKAADQYCSSDGRRLCSATEICGSGQPVVMGRFPGTRWAPTNDIENSWIQVGQDARFMACWEYTFVRGAFPAWGETTEHPEWKQDIYCCHPSPLSVQTTHCKQIKEVFLHRLDHQYKSEIHFPGQSWQLPSGMKCHCADDGFTECYNPGMCLGGHQLNEIFCSGNLQPFAQECSFPIISDRTERGAYVATENMKTHFAPECSVCQVSACKKWSGHWSEWEDWSECTAGCGEGMKRRFRLCRIGDCFGKHVEEANCIIKPCTDLPPDAWSRDILEWHNRFRRGHNSPPLVWDQALASSAQSYADHLKAIRATSVVHSPQGLTSDGKMFRLVGVAEMIAYKVKTDKVPVQEYMKGKDFTRSFYSEVRYYDWENPGHRLSYYDGNYVVGHFAQLIWKSTDKMGCGLMGSDDPVSDGMYVYISVCQYQPGGNDALTADEWKKEVPYFNKDLICEAECGSNKCYSFAGLHNSDSSSSCKCLNPTSPTCSSPCLAFCPGAEWNEMCYGEHECHCTAKAAVCDGLPVV